MKKIKVLSTQNEIGVNRLAVLEPKLQGFNIDYEVVYGDVDNGIKGHYNELTAWKSIINNNIDEDYLIIMEDDCTFRDEFSVVKLDQFIQDCINNDIVALYTGCSFVREPVKTTIEGIITVKTCTATQLTIIFKPIYELILNFPPYHVDMIISSFSQRGMKIGLTLPYLTGQLKTSESQITGFDIGEMFENEEQRLLAILNPPTA